MCKFSEILLILPNFAKFSETFGKFWQQIEIRERCKGVHCVDLGESFPTSIYLQRSASIQPRTSPTKFGGKYSILFTGVLSLECKKKHVSSSSERFNVLVRVILPRSFCFALIGIFHQYSREPSVQSRAAALPAISATTITAATRWRPWIRFGCSCAPLDCCLVFTCSRALCAVCAHSRKRKRGARFRREAALQVLITSYGTIWVCDTARARRALPSNSQ